MPTLTSPLQAIPAVLALGLDLDEAVANDEFEPVVYLLDSAGANFGYRYEWEAFGPFSSDLVRHLSQMTDTDFDAAQKLELGDGLRNAVEAVRPLVEPPQTLKKLGRARWLWLLAAVHFLERRSGFEVGNGKRAPFVDTYFEQDAIRAAKEKLAALP